VKTSVASSSTISSIKSCNTLFAFHVIYKSETLQGRLKIEQDELKNGVELSYTYGEKSYSVVELSYTYGEQSYSVVELSYTYGVTSPYV
jgi:hypothetical protein